MKVHCKSRKTAGLRTTHCRYLGSLHWSLIEVGRYIEKKKLCRYLPNQTRNMLNTSMCIADSNFEFAGQAHGERTGKILAG